MAKNFNAEVAKLIRKARYKFFEGAEWDLTVFDPSVFKEHRYIYLRNPRDQRE